MIHTLRRSGPRLAAALLALARLPMAVRAQIPAAEYAARRDSLARRIGHGVVVAFGARNPVTDFGPPTQLAAFTYLTNFPDPDAAFLMVVRNGVGTSTLFLSPVDPRVSLYYGRRADSSTVEASHGIRGRSFAALGAVLDSLAGDGLEFYSLADFEAADFASRDSLTRGQLFMRAFSARHPGVVLKDAHPLVAQLRARKSPAEIALLRKAVAISDAGHRAAMRAVRGLKHEYEVQAVAEYEFRRLGAARPGYGSIVGSGERGTQLHYMKDRGPIAPGDLIVIDAGAEYEGYSADITRTLPASGRFTADQRALYQLVLDAQLAAERNSRAGMPARAATDSSIEVRIAGLVKLGLIESAEATFDPPWRADCSDRYACRQAMLFMIHGISHGIGLEVHDPAGFRFAEGVFRPGDVFTIEPGLYVSTAALDLLPDTPKNRAFIRKARPVVERMNHTGVRIEDDYLVTEAGIERLSRAPRTIAEVEALTASGGGSPSSAR